MMLKPPVIVLSLLALGASASPAAAEHGRTERAGPRPARGDLITLENDRRCEVGFTVSRADRRDPYEFRLRGRRGSEARPHLEVSFVEPGERVRVQVLPDGRLSRRDLRGKVLVTVRADGGRGRVLERYHLPIDLRDGRHDGDCDCGACAGRGHDHGHRDRDHDRWERPGGDRHSHWRYWERFEERRWERAHRGHGHGRHEPCRHHLRRPFDRSHDARDLLRLILAARFDD